MMNQLAITHKKLGVNFNEGNIAEILLWAPLAQNAEIKIINRNLKLGLNKKEFGYWSLNTDQLHPGDTYKYILDGEKEVTDPASVSQPEGVHGPSQACSLNSFKWTDASWMNLPLNDYIMYELHTGTFSPEGNFAGIESKLDYLLSLGINAIEIMPVAQFPGNRNWGYDGVYPFAAQNSYGGVGGLQNLVNKCHEKGIAVILDVVYNHLGPEGNYLGMFGPYFTSKYNTPWGPALNFDDAWCDGVRRYFIENVLMWFRDFHIDGLRLDAVHAIKDFSPVHILREIKIAVDQLMKETGKLHHLIVELDLNDTRFINPLKDAGFGMDAQWIDEFHHALRVTAGEPKSGYYADFDGIAHLAKSYKDAYVYDGIYSPHRHKTFGIKAENNPGHQFIVFTQNHDHCGNRMLGERTSQLYSFEMNKVLAGAVICSPFLPMLWMGEEYAETNPFFYFVSHTDPQLVEAVRNGRKAEFAYFHDKGEAPDPQSENTFKQSQLQWNLLEKEQHKKMFLFYKKLIQLRKEHPVLKNLKRKQLEVSFDESQNTLFLHRWYDGNRIFCIMNFSKNQNEISIPAIGKGWKKLLDSADQEWNGPGSSATDIVSGDSVVKIQPESFLIYENNHA